MAFAADGQGIISGAKDGTVRLWPTNAAARERFYEGNWMPIKFSKDGRMLAAINDQSKFVLLNLRTGEPEDSLQLGKIPFSRWAGAVSDDFRVLVHPLPEGGLRVWDLQSRKSVDLESHEIHRILGGNLSRRNSTPGWRRKRFHAVVESPGPFGSTRCGSQGKGALFSRNGDCPSLHFTTGRSRYGIQQRGRLKRNSRWRLTSASALHWHSQMTAAFSRSGSNPITETENAIRLWDTRNGKLLGVCKGHTQGVRWLAFSPDGETLASVSDDSTLRFWNVRTQQELLSIQRLADPIRDILFSPDGHWLAAKTLGGLRLLDGSADLTFRPARPISLHVGEPKSQFSLTRAALSICRHQKRKFQSVRSTRRLSPDSSAWITPRLKFQRNSTPVGAATEGFSPTSRSFPRAGQVFAGPRFGAVVRSNAAGFPPVAGRAAQGAFRSAL